jgi:hypothetical protein
MNDRDKELMAVYQVPGQQASQSSLEELNQDPGENEPGPTRSVGQADHPVDGGDTG